MMRIAALSWGLGLGRPGVHSAMSLIEHGEPWNFLRHLQVQVVFRAGIALPIGRVLSPAHAVLALGETPAQQPSTHA